MLVLQSCVHHTNSTYGYVKQIIKYVFSIQKTHTKTTINDLCSSHLHLVL